MLQRLKAWAKRVRVDVTALVLAARDPRVPWYAKALAAATAAYALSPIDLIPDVIPVLGLVDDLLIVPAAIAVTISLVPAEVMAELRAEAARRIDGRLPPSRAGAAAIVVLWLAAASFVLWWLFGS